MDSGSTLWLVIFALAAGLFFTIAAIVAVTGFADLKKLLRHSKRNPTTGGED
ncbi:MAG TPA: hypothetical protein VNA22_04795 [Pyrinomonadaceae bacterium]|nr:hypothetical protein [Pyrinomonadaceae bacterium]